jgi:Cu+-exporting ATPase
MAEGRQHDHRARQEGVHGALITDPVCGMKVDPRTADHRYELGGTPYYFCGERCLGKFKADPDRYL